MELTLAGESTLEKTDLKEQSQTAHEYGQNVQKSDLCSLCKVIGYLLIPG